LGGFAIGARVALLWQHNANPSYKHASIPRYDDIVRTLGGVCMSALLAGDWRVTGGVLNITASAWTAGFHWWRSRNITRTQNVSEYMLLLALCLVDHGEPKKSSIHPLTIRRQRNDTSSLILETPGHQPIRSLHFID